MYSAVLAAYALCSLPLLLQPQVHLADVTWPTHAVVAVPAGAIKPDAQFCVLENDRPIVSQVEVAARWPDGSAKWLHAYAGYRYQNGMPARYELTTEVPAQPQPKSPLVVTDDASGIHINTGVISLTIPRPFAGITLAKYGDTTVLKGVGGPSVVDDRGLTWRASFDDKAEVVIEQQGPAQVTIRCVGWYQSADRKIEPFCRFVTRISAFAGSAIVKFDHATIFADDMRKQAVSELAFTFALAGARQFSSGNRNGNLRDDTSSIWLAQVSADRLLTLNEAGDDRAGPLRVSTTEARSAGWFSAELPDHHVALLTKDFWQKYPKEIKISRDELVYYAWPKHGQFAFPDETSLRLDGVYKFQCFLTGRLLDSRLPSEYFSVLEAQTDTTECKAEFARGANLEGVAMHNEFALAIVPAAPSGRRDNRYFEQLEKLYDQSPIATVGPEKIASSGALGYVVATPTPFPEIDRAAREGMLGYGHSIERYGDYGWCIYGNTHSEEIMNPTAAGVAGGRPSLHRVWNNNHYQHVSTSWRLAALDADPRLLRWARVCTDNYASIGEVRYDGMRGYMDGKGQHHDTSDVRYHRPASFWHCKAFVPWGGRAFGTEASDSDSAQWGHWPDPSALLYAWLIDANRWAKDGYDLWLQNVKLPTGGTRREVNTTLVHAITAYEYDPRPEFLTAIKGMVHDLSSVPLAQQQPGAIFEASWLTRYHELFPDDAAFNKFIVDNAQMSGTNIEGFWTLALCATAYQITKDESLLRRHAGTLDRCVRRVFHDQASDKRWDLYGLAPGPRDGHFMLQWHRFAAALRDAHITSLPPPDDGGTYFSSTALAGHREALAARGIKVLFWRDSQSATLDVQAHAIGGGGMFPAGLLLYSAKRQNLLNVPELPLEKRSVRPSTWYCFGERYPIPAADPGLYTALIGSERIGIFQPLTTERECQVLKNSKLRDSNDPNTLCAAVTRGYLVPLTSGRIRLTFTAAGPNDGSYISLRDLQGKPVLTRYLRAGESATATMNEPGGLQGPLLLDAFSDFTGFFKLSIVSNAIEPLLYGRRLEDVQWIRQKLGK